MGTLFETWLRKATDLALRLFDRWVMAVPVQLEMGRVVSARAGLQRAFYLGKCNALREEIAALTQEVVR
jgi:hypothetical protein